MLFHVLSSHRINTVGHVPNASHSHHVAFCFFSSFFFDLIDDGLRIPARNQSRHIGSSAGTFGLSSNNSSNGGAMYHERQRLMMRAVHACNNLLQRWVVSSCDQQGRHDGIGDHLIVVVDLIVVTDCGRCVAMLTSWSPSLEFFIDSSSHLTMSVIVQSFNDIFIMIKKK